MVSDQVTTVKICLFCLRFHALFDGTEETILDLDGDTKWYHLCNMGNYLMIFSIFVIENLESNWCETHRIDMPQWPMPL